MFKKTIFYIFLLFLLFSCGGDKDKDKNTTLRFSTFNLFDLENKNAYMNLANFIKSSDIDVMISQEIQLEDKEHLLKVLQGIGIDATIEFSTSGGYGEDYLAVISRVPIKSVKSVLEGSFTDPETGTSYDSIRPILEIKLNFNGADITIFNLHLKAQSPWPDCDSCISKRRASANGLAEYIKKNLNPINDNIIIAGDLNLASKTDADYKKNGTLDIITLKTDENSKNDFLDINYEYKREQTHTEWNSIMDHIILSPKLLKKYVDKSINIVIPEGKPSDHKALYLDLNFK